ncbi:MAG: hypothetical protein C0626_05860 [Arcobacter sp.]|uniref:class I SAM-dependent methyltransferase n=1 Tax=uncultured Arcobacter sp. TaxID=165434 RepID=UPI000CBD97C9|nr:methyltransferase domain-containing protein [uncultured Arcobacter sp.]PLY10499.1 MAG: hypothetical protein C0626_05860 [Arcobacter sp.]
MNKLTDYDLWNEDYDKKILNIENLFTSSSTDGLDKNDYGNYFLWDVLLNKFLPFGENKKVVEIGSAPGINLLQFKKQFGYQPFGIEYTKSGSEINKILFKKNNIDESNVIRADFFSEDIEQFYNFFDIVNSNGFIEHFDDVDNVIDRHMKLLKNDGYLVVIIPNLRGFYYHWTKQFNPIVLTHHNLKIMEIDSFKKLFQRDDLEELYCNYFGIFHYGLLTNEKSFIANLFLSCFSRTYKIFNTFFKLFFKKKGIESKVFSPYLVYIGKKNVKNIS